MNLFKRALGILFVFGFTSLLLGCGATQQATEGSVTPLSIIAVYDAPASNPSGLVWANSRLWSCDLDTYYIYKYKADLSTFEVAYTNPKYETLTDIAWDGSNFWTLCWYINPPPGLPIKYIVKHNLDMTIDNSSILQSPSGETLYALTWGEGNIWTGGFLRKIYKLDPSSGNVLGTYSVSFYVDGLAWDSSGNLWSCSQETDKIYKHMGVFPYTVVASYEYTPKDPTGLAWDGSNLWSCSSATGKIYKHNGE
jgi:hypothetical protein